MLVSIITVCYNSEETIKDTIESVLNQTYTDIEYLVIDGLSKDNTVGIAESYISVFRQKGIQYHISSEKDSGIYDAMNKGIKMSSGEIIGIINSDDWYEPNAVQTIVNAYKKSYFDMFYADIRLLKKNGDAIIKHSKMDKFVTSRHWNHPTSFVTKKTYNELGCFKCKGIHDDFDFFLRVRKSGKKICIVNIVLANFRAGGTSNDKSLEKAKQRIRDRYRIYRENGYGRIYLIECLAIEIAKFLIG
jgi:glycosyltransferase involved in cell wall biosynthesis